MSLFLPRYKEQYSRHILHIILFFNPIITNRLFLILASIDFITQTISTTQVTSMFLTQILRIKPDLQNKSF